MPIEEQLKKLFEEDGKEREKDENFTNLRDFYQKMKEAGFVAQPSYTLPPIDTAGKSLYTPHNHSAKIQ